jgi:hypothetical protein
MSDPVQSLGFCAVRILGFYAVLLLGYCVDQKLGFSARRVGFPDSSAARAQALARGVTGHGLYRLSGSRGGLRRIERSRP